MNGSRFVTGSQAPIDLTCGGARSTSDWACTNGVLSRGGVGVMRSLSLPLSLPPSLSSTLSPSLHRSFFSLARAHSPSLFVGSPFRSWTFLRHVNILNTHCSQRISFAPLCAVDGVLTSASGRAAVTARTTCSPPVGGGATRHTPTKGRPTRTFTCLSTARTTARRCVRWRR